MPKDVNAFLITILRT